jgi:hypothetical protein
MLQNRVDPFGNLIKTPARGGWMGNRGLLHDEHQNIIRPFKLKAWLICLLEFKCRKRGVMSPRLYTELFFLDEVTAFAAGHRPCFECRRKDHDRFKAYWITGNPSYGFDARVSIYKIDDILHNERMDRKGMKVIYEDEVKNLPDGTFVLIDSKPHLLANHLLHPWSPFGYEKGIPAPKKGKLSILTPRSTVNAFKAGYKPQLGL